MCEPTFDNDNVQIIRRGRGGPKSNKTPEEKAQAMRDCARKHYFKPRENRLMQQKALAEKKRDIINAQRRARYAQKKKRNY